MANVSPTYPANLVSYGTDVVDFTSTVLAAHVNTLRAEVVSLETVLGTYPTLSSGWIGTYVEQPISYTWNTLKDRLNNIEYGLHAAHAAMVPTGGTQYQVLEKQSSTNYDFAWVTLTGLPTISSGTNNYILTNNGTTAAWTATISGGTP